MVLIPIAREKDIKRDKIYPVGDIILTRNSKNEVIYLERKCPHLGYDLACGRVNQGQVICPYHNRLFAGQNSGLQIQKGMVFIENGDKEQAGQYILKYLFENPYLGSSWHRVEINCNYKNLLSNLVDFEHFDIVHGNSAGIGLSKPQIKEITSNLIKVVWDSKFNRAKSSVIRLQDFCVVSSVPYYETTLIAVNLVLPVSETKSVLFVNSCCNNDFYNYSLVMNFWKNLILRILTWQDKRILEKVYQKQPELYGDYNPLIKFIWSHYSDNVNTY